jgi:hypothetical protein
VDVFESFRESAIRSYKLDVAFFYTLASFTYSCVFYHTRTELELITDPNQISFVNNARRGGITTSVVKHCTAYNEMTPGYQADANREKKYIHSIDVNSLYTHIMNTEHLPTGNYRWLDENDMQWFNQNLMSFTGKESTGYLMCVDIDVPEHLHDKHSDFPFLVEALSVTTDYNKRGTTKLIGNLFHKRNYYAHYRIIQQALKYGLILVKIHRVLAFDQSNWLSKYITMNAELRAKPNATKAEVALYKNMSNLAFGKFIEEVRNHRDLKIVTNYDDRTRRKISFHKLIINPAFHSFDVVDENFVLVELKKTSVCFKQPIAVGVSILELSKVFMFESFYRFKLDMPGLRLLYSDTDSLCMSINQSLYTYMLKNPQLFDTSNFPIDNIHNIVPQGRRETGRFHDEVDYLQTISDFVSLRSKCYACKMTDASGEIVTNKFRSNGTPKSVSKKFVFSDYYNASLVKYQKNYVLTFQFLGVA